MSALSSWLLKSQIRRKPMRRLLCGRHGDPHLLYPRVIFLYVCLFCPWSVFAASIAHMSHANSGFLGPLPSCPSWKAKEREDVEVILRVGRVADGGNPRVKHSSPEGECQTRSILNDSRLHFLALVYSPLPKWAIFPLSTP